MSSVLEVYCDASYDDRTAVGSIGWIVKDEQGNTVLKHSKVVKKAFNSESLELLSILSAITSLKDRGYINSKIFLFTDSLNAVRFVNSGKGCKDYELFLSKIRLFMGSFSYIVVAWIPRSRNMEANAIARVKSSPAVEI
ncbi:MAG: ribonuclease H family protein [Nitrososphaeria archaeon]